MVECCLHLQDRYNQQSCSHDFLQRGNLYLVLLYSKGLIKKLSLLLFVMVFRNSWENWLIRFSTVLFIPRNTDYIILDSLVWLLVGSINIAKSKEGLGCISVSSLLPQCILIVRDSDNTVCLHHSWLGWLNGYIPIIKNKVQL